MAEARQGPKAGKGRAAHAEKILGVLVSEDSGDPLPFANIVEAEERHIVSEPPEERVRGALRRVPLSAANVRARFRLIVDLPSPGMPLVTTMTCAPSP